MRETTAYLIGIIMLLLLILFVYHSGSNTLAFEVVVLALLMITVTELPKISLKQSGCENFKHYYIDFRLRELRNVDNPHDSIEFDDLNDEQIKEIFSQIPNADLS